MPQQAMVTQQVRHKNSIQFYFSFLFSVEASPKLVNNKLPKSTNNNGTFSPLIVSHNTILCSIFEPLYQHPDVDKQLLANLMIDFFLCLKQRKISIQVNSKQKQKI
jgi:hypothetical protein